MKSRLVLLCLTFISLRVNAQSLLLVDSVKISSGELISVDQRGNIYLADFKGSIYQYSDDLEQKVNYSPPKPFKVAQLDTWRGLRVFCFYRDIQEFVILDRFLTAQQNYEFNLPSNRFIGSATLSYDNNLWLIDQPSMTLLKYIINQRRIEFSVPLNNIITQPLGNIVFFKEHQNHILIGDQHKGLFIFDIQGNFVLSKKLFLGENVNVFEDYLFTREDQYLVFRNLYAEESYQLKIPNGLNPNGFTRYKEKVYFFEGEKLYKLEVK